MTDTAIITHLHEGDPIDDTKCLSPGFLPGDTGTAARMINRLRTLHANMNTQLNVTRNAHEHDIQVIGARLMAEAEDRGWCDAYDDVIADLNQNLHRELPVRVKTYQMQGKYTVYIDVEVEASSLEEAEELAKDEIEQLLDGLDGCDDYDKDWISRTD
jgi:hypothetical protein